MLKNRTPLYLEESEKRCVENVEEDGKEDDIGLRRQIEVLNYHNRMLEEKIEKMRVDQESFQVGQVDFLTRQEENLAELKTAFSNHLGIDVETWRKLGMPDHNNIDYFRLGLNPESFKGESVKLNSQK